MSTLLDVVGTSRRGSMSKGMRVAMSGVPTSDWWTGLMSSASFDNGHS